MPATVGLRNDAQLRAQLCALLEKMLVMGEGDASLPYMDRARVSLPENFDPS